MTQDLIGQASQKNHEKRAKKCSWTYPMEKDEQDGTEDSR